MKNLLSIFSLLVLFTSTTLAQDPINVSNAGGDCSNSDFFSANAFSQYDFSETINGKPSYVSDGYGLCHELVTEAQCNTQPGDNIGYIIRWTGTRWEWFRGNGACFWLIDKCVAAANAGNPDEPVDDVLLAYNTQNTATPPETGWIANTGFSCVPAINTTLGITQTTFSSHLSVHPNPSKGKFKLIIGNIQNMVTAKLYNLLGQQMWSRTEKDTYGFEFEIEQPNGIYFLELLGDNGEKAQVKLVKF